MKAHLNPRIAVIILTYNSDRFLGKTLDCLQAQSLQATSTIVIDNGSSQPEILKDLIRHLYPTAQLELLGAAQVINNHDYILFLNPDTFLFSDFLEKACHFMEKAENQQVGAVSGTLLGYDIKTAQPTGFYDSTGIFQTWYGHWYDRHQGSLVEAKPEARPEMVPALCAACIFCRTHVLKATALSPNEFFDKRFFMYKEDIELSLRLRKAGWQLIHLPDLLAYHCRGWSKNRQSMSRQAKRLSALNELRLCQRYPSLRCLFSILKASYVLGFEAR
jgi:N-acetylglucosaminyl-diphospho-decaprenol L-rhamnosyltransferase